MKGFRRESQKRDEEERGGNRAHGLFILNWEEMAKGGMPGKGVNRWNASGSAEGSLAASRHQGVRIVLESRML